MTTKQKVLSLASSLVLGAAGATKAFATADEPTTPAAADQMAQHERDLAAQYRAMGAVGYKTGLVQRADADAAKYQAMADEMASPPAPAPQSLEVEHYSKLADQYRAMGAVGYKTGLVQRAEADAAKHEESQTEPAAEPVCDVTKPAVEVNAACTGDRL